MKSLITKIFYGSYSLQRKNGQLGTPWLSGAFTFLMISTLIYMVFWSASLFVFDFFGFSRLANAVLSLYSAAIFIVGGSSLLWLLVVDGKEFDVFVRRCDEGLVSEFEAEKALKIFVTFCFVLFSSFSSIFIYQTL
jgi:hypothetical protein